jgi:beta-lactam-binding protein with PASTA domain
MPNVVGMGRRDAERALADEEIVIAAIIPEYSDIYPPGVITEQSITPTSQVLAKSTRVTLRISQGPRPLTEEERRARDEARERERLEAEELTE